MELSKLRRYRRRLSPAASLFFRNPSMLISLELPFLIATSVSLRAAAAMSLELLIIHMGTMTAALITRKYCGGWVRPMVNIMISTLLMAFTRLWLITIFRGVTDILGMYVYLMAINGMTVAQSCGLDKKFKPGPVLTNALLGAIGFSVAMFAISLPREYFGNGTLWGTPVPTPIRISTVSAPFFGFICVGFLIAGAKLVGKKLMALAINERARRDARFSVVSGRG